MANEIKQAIKLIEHWHTGQPPETLITMRKLELLLRAYEARRAAKRLPCAWMYPRIGLGDQPCGIRPKTHKKRRAGLNHAYVAPTAAAAEDIPNACTKCWHPKHFALCPALVYDGNARCPCEQPATAEPVESPDDRCVYQYRDSQSGTPYPCNQPRNEHPRRDHPFTPRVTEPDPTTPCGHRWDCGDSHAEHQCRLRRANHHLTGTHAFVEPAPAAKG